jgi:putative transposase
MSTHIEHKNRDAFYYFTITCFNWISLFEITNLYENIYEWFDILKKRRVLVNAYVLMPNHMHGVVYCAGISKPVNTILGTGKRFMAYEIVNILEKQRNTALLGKMQNNISELEHVKGYKHKVFESSMDIKEIESEKFMIQKVNYIHRNPVSGKWKLANDYRLFEYSSAGFYEPAEGNIYKGYPVTHYIDMDYEFKNP